MHSMEAVKQAASITGVSLRAVSKGMGHVGNYVNTTITKGSTPKADTLARMLNQAGYKLCAIPADNVPPDALIID